MVDDRQMAPNDLNVNHYRVITACINAIVKAVACKELMLSKGVVVPNQIIILFIGIGQAKLIHKKAGLGVRA